MTIKGHFKLAVLPGTLAGFYCNNVTNGQYFSECCIANPLTNSNLLSSTNAIGADLYRNYKSTWYERNILITNVDLTITINPNNPNELNFHWKNGSFIFNGIAQRQGDWIFGHYWD
ncbi:MAG: hypothetical protein MUC81_12990 [Bacteroidia bacterium]|jgi:hypothetical protein|nr:hypothetical protein [Bacteroidia bacterium]